VANTIKLSIKVDDDGSLSVVGKEAKKAAGNLDKVSAASDKTSKSAKSADRNMKGLSKQSANANKNFSKMQQGMTGGLVPAYAILASNVFALSAAFEFFKRAADLSNLEASQVSYAENTGIALGSITQRLREASGGMLGFKESAQAAAIGMAKGFSPSQLEALAEGARKASTALGRNFEDSFDRLIRGASKAEPELLDELGITLRLEDATKKYADSIGKSAKELNTYQRSQAVLIETQRQLEKNFGGMDAAVNPFIALSKVLNDIIKAVTNFFLPMFAGIAGILSTSIFAAVSAFGLLALSIAKTIIPMEGVNNFFKEFEENSGNSLAAAQDDLDKYVEEWQDAAEDLETTQLGGKMEMQHAAQQALDQGADSPTLQRAAKGEMKKGDEAQLKKMFDGANSQIVKQGEVTKNTLKGVSNDVVKSMRKGMRRASASGKKEMGKIRRSIGLVRKTTKVVFSWMEMAARKTFLKMAGYAKKFGGAMNKAMKFSGVIGILILIGEALYSLAQSPMTIARGFARMADNIINFMAPMIDWVAKGFLGLVDGVIDNFNSLKTTLAKVVNFIAQGFQDAFNTMLNAGIELVNKLIEGLNLINPLTDIKPITPVENKTVELMDESSKAASNLAGSYEEVDVYGTRAMDMLESSAVGKGMDAWEKTNDAIKASTAAYKEFVKSADAAHASLQGIVTGMAQAEAKGVNPIMNAFKGLVSLDIGGLFQKLNQETSVWEKQADNSMGFSKKQVLSGTDRALAIKRLTAAMRGLGELSPKYAAALKAASEGDETALMALSEGLAVTQTNLMFFKEGLEQTKNSVKNSLSGGNMKAGIAALRQLETAGIDAGEGIEDATVKTGAVAKLAEEFKHLFGEDTDTGALLDKMIAINAETEAIAATSSVINFLSSEASTIAKEMLDIRKNENDLATQRLALTKELGAAEQLEVEQKIRLLELEQKLLKTTKMRRLISEVGGQKGVSKTATGGANRALDRANLRTEEQGYISQLSADPMMEATDPAKYAQLTASLGAVDDKMKALQVTQAKGLFKDMAADFAALGPEGEMMSAVSMGMGNMIGAMQLMGEAGADSATKIQAGFMAASAVISSLSAIMNAANKNRIAGIDAEIKAEKKKDGKSKESIAKLKALEAKKTALKKKAFEVNKKMQMAQIVMSTASAIIATAASNLGPPWAIPMMVMMAAMGAAQLAVVAGTSFQGGGSAGSTATPTTASVGKRKSSVDLAKSQSAAGELAYLRGAQGQGGPENFKRAFYGGRHRAAGGNAGYVVGEQGPELFMPDRPGTIVANDDIDTTAGGSNVTFNINTIDSAGVEDVLTEQQGNIIGMIRSAANEYGDPFLENVDTSIYSTPFAGYRRA
jgi:hypothetical protein